VNGPCLVDCGILAFVDSTGKPGDGGEIVSPVILLYKPERAVSVESEESMVNGLGDSGLVIGTVRGCSMSGLGSAYGLILPVP
jgi:hypothetical protein